MPEIWDQLAKAAEAFRDAVSRADELLRRASDNISAQDDKALALCGLACTGDPDQAAAAEGAFRNARAVTTAAGIVRHTLKLFDLIAADRGDILEGVRHAATGNE